MCGCAGFQVDPGEDVDVELADYSTGAAAGPHPSEYIEPETLYESPFADRSYGPLIDGDFGFDGSDERPYPGDDVDDGGVEDVEVDRLPGD